MYSDQNSVTLLLGEKQSALQINPAIAGRSTLPVALGWANVLPGPLRVTPPGPLDLEMAIQYIEEQVMPLARDIPAGALVRLVCTEKGAPDLLPALSAGASPAVFHVDEIELRFGRLCAIAEGSPAGNDQPLVEPATAAALLVVRELMHHCRITHIMPA